MYQRVFLRKDSRNYHLRYRLSDGPKIYEVSLYTHIKEIAAAKATKLILEEERDLLGIGPPKALREAAQHPVSAHLTDFIKRLGERNRCKSHILHTKYRLQRLIEECKWKLFRDVSPDKFSAWLAGQEKLSNKTRNEYLGHANAFFNWAERHGRIAHNPLKCVHKQETVGRETFKRRALSLEELVLLVKKGGKRGLAYLVAGCTGLRRGEMKQLLWSDVRLDGARLFIDVRAATTKSKKAAIIPLVPALADALQTARAKGINFTGRVFPRGLPSVKTLAKDLQACGIAVEDERGFRVDFHALRHTFVSLLSTAGISELARVKLARHSEWKQTDRYTDPHSIPLFAEMDKLALSLPSPIPSPNSGKTRPNEGKVVQSESEQPTAETADSRGEEPVLAGSVHTWEDPELVPEGGLEPPCD